LSQFPTRHGRTRRRLTAVAAVLTAAVCGGIAVTAFGGPRGPDGGAASQTSTVGSAPTGGAVSLADGITATQAKLRTQPKNWLAWSDLGNAYVQQGRITADPTYYPKARTALDRSLALNSRDNYMAMTGMASLAAAQHDFSGSLRWAKRAVRVNPAGSASYAVMADALNELGRYDEAQRALQKAVDLKPGVSTFTRVSYVRELRGDVAGAVAAMQMASRDAFSPSDKAFATYFLGMLWFNSGNLDAAGRAFDEGLRADPSYAALHAGRARVAAAEGRSGAAIADYTAAVGRLPLPEYLVEFGDYLTSLGRHAEAQRQYDLVAVEVRLFRANGVNSDLDIALFQAQHGNAAAAVAAGRAEWNRRHSIIVADALGWALHMAGEDKSALRYARFATSLGYRNALYYFHRGMIEKGLGDRSAARSHLRLALKINPYFSPLWAPQARKALAAMGTR
jgi:tetratricopeptide (TPR) repeat protein